jgi:hypothetical protein
MEISERMGGTERAEYLTEHTTLQKPSEQLSELLRAYRSTRAVSIVIAQDHQGSPGITPVTGSSSNLTALIGACMCTDKVI